MFHGRILLLGLGDLGRRLATSLIDLPEVDELVLVSRDRDRGSAFARLLSACGETRCRFAAGDGLHTQALATLLSTERPALIVQCGSLLSPREMPARSDPAARALCAAGFALQLPAQLPIIMSLMRAVKLAGLSSPVVNCSYPDVTHAALARLGLEPLIGIGNVGMIAACVTGAARCRGSTPPLVRVLAHHAHVSSTLTGGEPCPEHLQPRVYAGEEGVRVDDWARRMPPLAAGRELNMLSAAHARSIIRALLSTGTSLRTSAPGPQGLQGGFPVKVCNGRVELDLPGSLTWADALEFQSSSAALDGVAEIAQDGSVSFTAHAQRAVRELEPALAAPLHPEDALARFDLLTRVMRAPAP
jgi:hypothetical protein